MTRLGLTLGLFYLLITTAGCQRNVTGDLPAPATGDQATAAALATITDLPPVTATVQLTAPPTASPLIPDPGTAETGITISAATMAPTAQDVVPGQEATSTPLPASVPDPTIAVAPPTANTCSHSWFMAEPPELCPSGPARASYAAGQQFEHGQMIWVELTDTFYLLFAAGAYPGDDRAVFRTVGPLVLLPSASADNRVGVEPQLGQVEPVSGFGLLWRGEVDGLSIDLRQALGWALAAETGFETMLQCQADTTYSAHTCFLQDSDGSIIKLAGHALVGDVWSRR